MSIRNFSLAVGLGLSLITGIGPSLAQDAPESVFGFWVNRNGWVIEAAPCGDGICGQIVAVGGTSSNPQRYDEFNPDPALRTRPLCGLTIFGSFEPNGEPNEWEGGWIYNPRDGETYSSNMALAEDGNLEVRGYVLSPMFGRTIVLTPGEKPAEFCDQSETASYDSANAE